MPAAAAIPEAFLTAASLGTAAASRCSARRRQCVLSTDAQEGFWREEREIERATSGSRALGLETARPYNASLDRRRGLGARAESVASRDDGLPLSPHSLRDGGVFSQKEHHTDGAYRRAVRALT